MTLLEQFPAPPPDHEADHDINLELRARWLPVLLRLFIGSGCAALIYEVVWFQLLQLSIGSSAVSLGVLLGIYMGGMCLGSLLLPRYVGARHHPLRVYAFLELGIGFVRRHRPVWRSRHRWSVHRVGRHRNDEPHSPGARRQYLPAAPDLVDGSDAPGCRARCRGDARRRLVARVLLWRQSCRSCRRKPAGGLLPAAGLRHANRDDGRGCAERDSSP